MIESFLNRFGLREIQRHEAPGLHQFVEQSAKKLGITDPVRLLHSDSPVASVGANPNRTKQGQHINGIIITDGARKLLNDQEMKAIIGHELSHLNDYKNASKLMNIETYLRLPIYTLPLAFACGYYVLDKAYREQQKSEHSNMTLLEAVQYVVTEDLKAAKHFVVDEKLGFTPDTKSKDKKNLTEEKAAWYEMGMRMGGTIAAAAVGYIAGLGLARHHSLSAEFRSDRMGAMLVGNANPMISAINKITRNMEEAVTKQTFRGGFITTSPNVETAMQQLWQRIVSYYKQEKLIMVDLESVMAHPTTFQRANALQKIPAESFQNFVEKSRTTASPHLSA